MGDPVGSLLLTECLSHDTLEAETNRPKRSNLRQFLSEYIIMLTIRLQRIGKNKRPSYRVIVSEKGRDPHARSLEILGSYNPLDPTKKLTVDASRVQYWISKGAQTSDTIFNLFLKNEIVKGTKKMSVSITKKRQTKIATKKAEEAKKVAEAAPTA